MKKWTEENGVESAENGNAQPSDPVRDYILKSHFGIVEKFTEPFTKQMKEETRRLFDDDEKWYDEIDRSQSKITRLVSNLRLITFIGTFIPYVLLVYIIISIDEVRLIFNIKGLDGVGLSNIALIVGAGGAFFALRQLLRWAFLDKSEDAAILLGARMKEMNSFLRDEISRYCQESRTPRERQLWQATAYDAIRRAIWTGTRQDYLDRYSTTAFWKITSRTTRIERSYIGLKVLILSLTTWWLWTKALSAWELSAFIGIGLLGWVVFRRKNTLWADALSEASEAGDLTDDKREYHHHFSAVARVVRDLVATQPVPRPGFQDTDDANNASAA